MDMQVRRPLRRWLPAVCALAVSLCALIAALALLLGRKDNAHSYLLRDGQTSELLRMEPTDPTEIPALFGHPLENNDWLEVTETEQGTEITIHRVQQFTLQADGEIRQGECSDATVGEALASMGITLDEDDYTQPDLYTRVEDGMEIAVIRVEYKQMVTDEVLPCESETLLDESLPSGETLVEDEGEDGLRRTTTVLRYENGKLIDTEQSVELLREPRTRRVSISVTHTAIEGTATLEHYEPPKPAPASGTGSRSTSGSSGGGGTGSSSTTGSSGSSYSNSSAVSSAGGGVLTTASGQTFTYTQVLACSATAYTTEGYTEKHNASGNIARVGTVAVDPKVIPLGTALYIATDDGEYIYGYCVAEDTGGAVKGNIVDLFFDTLAECYAFGRRNCTVYVLG